MEKLLEGLIESVALTSTSIVAAAILFREGKDEAAKEIIETLASSILRWPMRDLAFGKEPDPTDMEPKYRIFP